ncbi:MAG TPA: gliding motility protein GldM [Flavitalea sp.]|nr:gliding motility protein GldM [Flavitalea sp.]
MSLPKEPRQKMINMMYLVLTALLALNVSSEILNAFKTVNTSIVNANGVLTGNNNNIYSSFAAKLADGKTREKAEIWMPRAVQAQKLSKEVYDYIDQLKQQLMKEAKFDPNGDTTSWTDNLDASTRLMDKQGKGDELRKKLETFKKNLLSIDPAIGKEFANKLPIDLSVPRSQTGNKNPSWTTNYFHMTPAIAATTILSKFQNDVKSAENQIVTYCHSQVDAVAVRFDKYGFVGGLSSSYLMPGEKVTVYSGLGATSSAAQPTITINGRPVSLNADGLATADFDAGGTGSHNVNVVIKYVNQEGITQTINKTLEYTVGAPSGIAVSADKMNVLYIGVDNPLTITAGVGSEKVSASFSGGTITKVGGSKYIAKPSNNPGEHTVTVRADGKSTPVKFRVKYLPKPGTFVGGSRGGSISAATFKAQGGMVARLEDSEFDAQYRVVSYRLGASGGAFPVYQEAANESNRWNGSAAAIVGKATPGTSVYFDQIRVVGPDGRTVEVAPMVFNLK